MILRKNFEISFQKFYQERPSWPENLEAPKNKELRGSPDIRELREEAQRLRNKMEDRWNQFADQAGRLNTKKESEAWEAGKVEKALAGDELGKRLTWLWEWTNWMTLSDKTKAEVVKSFQEKPFDTEGKTPAEIQAEVEARTIEQKVKEIKARELSPAKWETWAQSESDYIKELEKKYWLGEDSLMAIRARNQTGIGKNIDGDPAQSGKITDPEWYKIQMENLAKNAKKAQEYAKKNEALLDAWNRTIAGNVMAILEGKDPTKFSEAEQKYIVEK